MSKEVLKQLGEIKVDIARNIQKTDDLKDTMGREMKEIKNKINIQNGRIGKNENRMAQYGVWSGILSAIVIAVLVKFFTSLGG